MSIDIKIVEKIDDKIKTKIEDIGNAAERAHAQVEKLKKVLSIKASADSNALKSWQDQERALNRVIASENRLATQVELNAQRIARSQLQTQVSTTKSNNAIAKSNEQLQNSLNQIAASAQKTANSVAQSNARLQSTTVQTNNQIAASNAKLQATYQQISTSAQKAANSLQASAARMQAAMNNAANAITVSNAKAQASLDALAKKSAKQQQLDDLALKRATVQANNQIALSNARLAAGLDRLSSSTARYTASNSAMVRGLRSAQLSFASMNSSLQNLEHGFNTATSRLRGFLATMVLLGSTGRVVETLDTFQTMQNQLSQNTQDPRQLRGLTNSIFDMAQTARVPLEGLAKIFRRVDDAIAPMNKSLQDSIDITGTMAGLISLSGANATEASAALLQLSQAFSKGKLDGDEFRTTAELMPVVLRELAKTLGVSRGALFDLSKEGKLTAKDLVDTFTRIGPQINAQLKSMPRTIGQAFTQLKNQINLSLSRTSTESGFSAAIVAGLDAIRNNMDMVANSAIALGAVLATITGIGIVGWLSTMLNPITSLTLALTGAVAYFAYFSNSIKVAGEGSAKLSSYVKILASDIKTLLSNKLKDWFNIFDANSAQRNFNALKVALKGVVDLYVKLAAAQEAAREVDVSATDTSESGRFAALLQYGKNLVDLFKTGLKSAVESANEAMRVFFDAMFDKIGKILGAVRDLQVGFLNLTKAGYEYMGWNTDGISNSIKNLQNQDYSAKGLRKMFGMDEQSMNDFVQQAAKDFEKIFNGAIKTIKFTNPFNQPGMVNDWLLEQSKRDSYKDSPFFRGFDKLEKEPKKLAQIFEDSFIKALERIEKQTKEYFDNVQSRAKNLEFSEYAKSLNELEMFGEPTNLDLSASRFNEFGQSAEIAAESINQASNHAQNLASYFGDAHKYAEGIQNMMRSVNADMVDDLAKYQTQLQNRNIEQSIRSDPNAFLGHRSNWNPDFIKGVAGGGEALDTSQHLQNLTTLSNAVAQIDAQLAQINAAPIAAIGTSAQQAAQKAQQSMATGVSAINTSLQQISTSPIDKVNQQVNAVGGKVPQIATAVQTVGTTAQQAAQQATTATQQAATSAQTASQQISTSIEGGVQAAQQAVASVDGSGFQGITQAAQQAGTTIGQSISQGAQQAGQGIQQMAAQATAAFGQIMQAANQAAEAIRRLIEMQNRAGGGLPGFSSGGYTGNVGVNTPAGIVHGQEYVMPAGPTRKYRDLLEAMRSGRLSTGTMPTGGRGSVGGSNVNVTVENYGSSNIEVQQLSATEIRIIARDEARREGTRAVAQAINNPNSRVSKSLLANTTSTRRR